MLRTTAIQIANHRQSHRHHHVAVRGSAARTGQALARNASLAWPGDIARHLNLIPHFFLPAISNVSIIGTVSTISTVTPFLPPSPSYSVALQIDNIHRFYAPEHTRHQLVLILHSILSTHLLDPMAYPP
jgi:hypothetical protein